MLDEPLLEQIKIFSQDIGYISISSVQRKFMLSYTHQNNWLTHLFSRVFVKKNLPLNMVIEFITHK